MKSSFCDSWLVCAYVWVFLGMTGGLAHTMQLTCKGQRTTLWSLVSLLTFVWIWELNSGSQATQKAPLSSSNLTGSHGAVSLFQKD